MNAMIEEVFDHVRGAWRFRWAALALSWALCLLAWGVIFLIPDTYQASARVFVDTKTALSQVTRGISVETDFETQIQRVRQALLGGPQLQKVAEETGLLADAHTPQEKQLALDALRTRIDIAGGVSHDTPGTGVYAVSYKNTNRETSLRVVDQLVKAFVADTLGGKREGSEQAQQFLVNEIADYEHRLADAEERLADFKRKNVGLMPGAQGDYFTRLQAEMDALTKAQTNLGVATQRLDELQRQLRGEEPLVPGAPGAAAGVPVPAAPGPVGAVSDTAIRIREAQAKLDDLLLRFTDKHPDVIALKATVEELKKRQQDEIAAARAGDQAAAARTGLTANPVFQNIQLQYNQTSVEIAAIRAEIADHQRKIASLKEFVDTAPQVEAQFAQLNRDYDVTKAQYQALLQRLEHARVSEEAEATGIVRFEVIDPPTASFQPVAPNRPVLIVAALVFSIAAGGGLAYLLNLMKPVFATTRQLAAATGLPVLGAVSVTLFDRVRFARRRSIFVYATALAVLLGLTGGVLVAKSTIAQHIRNLIA